MTFPRHAGLDPAYRFLGTVTEEEAGSRIKSGMTKEGFADAAFKLAGLAGALLGWRPGEFWAATPAELGAVFGALAPKGEAPPDGDALAGLMEMFPDG